MNDFLYLRAIGIDKIISRLCPQEIKHEDQQGGGKPNGFFKGITKITKGSCSGRRRKKKKVGRKRNMRRADRVIKKEIKMITRFSN